MTSYLRQKLSFSSLKLSSSSSDKEEENGSEAENAVHQDQTYDDEMERSKIKDMRSLLLSQHPSSFQDVDDLMIRRFLRARDHDIEKASSMLFKYLSWRKEFVPNGSISPSQIRNDLAQNKLFMQGHDKLGRPIVMVFGGRHKQNSLEEFKRYVTYSLDKICSRMPPGQEKFVSIADLEGWGYANTDIRGYLGALSILQDCYPERLGKLYLVHVPSVFMTAWKVVYPFIDSKTKKKIIFVENKKLKSTLLADIDESQLPETYGGKLPLVPIQDC